MIIAIDLDSTLNTLSPTALERYNAEWDDNLAVEDIKSWNTHLYVKSECGTAFYKYYDDADVLLACDVEPGAQDVVNGWLDQGHDVIVVSTTTTGVFGAKLEWLAKHFPRIPAKNYIASHRKELILADVLIDDGYHNLVNFPGIRILYAQPWNKDQWLETGAEKGIVRIGSWPLIDLFFKAQLFPPALELELAA